MGPALAASGFQDRSMWHCSNMAGIVMVTHSCCFFAAPPALMASPERGFTGNAVIFGLAGERGGSPLCASGTVTTNTILLADSEEFDMNYLRMKWSEWQKFPC